LPDALADTREGVERRQPRDGQGPDDTVRQTREETQQSRSEKMSEGWRVTEDKHVIPVADDIAHDDNEGCWCIPTYDAGVWVHHSRDGREYIEQPTLN